MAIYYLDSTITSTNGTGDGSSGDPFGKTDDLIHYVLTQISVGAEGDQFVIRGNGTLNHTTPIDFYTWRGNSTGTNNKPVCIRPEYVTGTFTYAMNGQGLYARPVINYNQPPISVQWHKAYFKDYSNPTSATLYPFRIGQYCAFVGCTFDGSLQTHSGLISGITNTHVIGCRIIGNRAILNGSSNGSYLIVGIDYVNHNHITAASSATNDGPYYTIGGSNGTYYTKNIFIDNLGYTNGFMIPQSNATVVNNTFYGSGAGRAIYVPGTYEHVMNICNNYIENWANGIGTNNGYTRPNNQLVAGNCFFNVTDPYNGQWDANNCIYDFENNAFFNNQTLTSSGVVDAAGLDFNPNKNMGTGFRHGSLAGINLGDAYVGAVLSPTTVVPITPRVRG